jgi:hypothetical protein
MSSYAPVSQMKFRKNNTRHILDMAEKTLNLTIVVALSL